MRNTVSDLNNALFAQIERLDDEELTGDKLKEEIGRIDAILKVSEQILSCANLALQATKIKDAFVNPENRLPKMLEE